MIAIIDYDAGNIRSVENALQRLGADYTLTADDYTVTYANAIDAATTNANDNVNAGTVIATVTGKGEWIDSTNVTFTISKAHLTITADNVTVPLHTPWTWCEFMRITPMFRSEW